MTARNRSRRQGRRGDRSSPTRTEPTLGVKTPLIDRHLTCVALVCLTVLLKSLIFAPIAWWPVSFVCLVPWLVLVGGTARAPRVYFYSYVMGFAFFLINARWLYPATREGYVALSAYLAAYLPLVACPVRSVVRRRRWPLAVVFPLVWVGGEMVRAVVVSGFPWFYLAHSSYKVLTLIQISDLVGAYGVSFVVAAVNGAVADLLLARLAARGGAAGDVGCRRPMVGVVGVGLLVLATCVYGQIQLRRDTTSPGPKVAVFQGDFVNSAYEVERVSARERLRIYTEMIDEASQLKPDLYLLPESPWPMVLNPEARDYSSFWRQCFAALRNRSIRYGAMLVTGSGSRIETPFDLTARERVYNSATVFYPDGREPGRYDKVHLVPFGEFVPFRFGRFRFLYFWLNALMPFSGEDGAYEYSVFPGAAFTVFEMKARSVPDRVFRFGIPICYEDVMPYVSREFVCGGHASKRADILLNISNDGWFGRGIQQPQHMAISVFRAVENRVGIARAVNTGVSGFVEPSGRIHDIVEGDPSNGWPGIVGYSVATLGVDSRYTLYSRFGDWFGWGCAFMWLVFFVDYWIVRVRASRDERKAEASE